MLSVKMCVDPYDTVYPGDTITVGFTKSGATWNQAWSVVRGPKGKAAGATASSGSFAYTFRELTSILTPDAHKINNANCPSS